MYLQNCPKHLEGELIPITLYQGPKIATFAKGGLARAAQQVRKAGRYGDTILIHVNEGEFKQLRSAWGNPEINPATGLPEYSWLSKKLKSAKKHLIPKEIRKVVDFELSNLKSMIKGAKKNPLSLLLGAATPVGAKLWGGITGKKFEPLVNMYGGPTEQSFRDAEARGIDTGPARKAHKVAQAVASYYGGKGALSGLGKLAGAGMESLGGGALSRAGNSFGPTYGATDPMATIQFPVSGTQSAVSGISPAIVPGIPELGMEAIEVAAPTLAETAGSGIMGTLGQVGGKVWDYAKKNPIQAVTALGMLAQMGKSQKQPSAPKLPDWYNEPLPEYEFNRRQTMPPGDPFSYGMGPEMDFYEENQLPVPEMAQGGALSQATSPDDYYTYGAMPEPMRFGAGEDEPMGMYRGGYSLRHGGSPYVDLGSAASGRADNIDAKLSENEYVIDAETVALLGDGNPEAGAKKLDSMRASIRKHKGGALSRGKFSPIARDPMAYLGAR